jgi:hypothetical protein
MVAATPTSIDRAWESTPGLDRTTPRFITNIELQFAQSYPAADQ